jgi:hypothetical protein
MADLAAPPEVDDASSLPPPSPSQDLPSPGGGAAPTPEGSLVPGGAFRDPPKDPFPAILDFSDATDRLLNPSLAGLREVLDAPFRIPPDWGDPTDISVPLWDPAEEPDSLRSHIHREFGYDVMLARVAQGLPPYDGATAANDPGAALANAFAEGPPEDSGVGALGGGQGANVAAGRRGH